MQETIKILLGTLVLILAYPIGKILKNSTKDEQVIGRPWFILLTIISLLVGFTGLFMRNDWLMFTSFFITIVTSQNLIN